MKRTYVLMLLIASVCQAQQLVEAPTVQTKTPIEFWVLTAAYSGAIGMDTYTSHRGQTLGCVEGNPWLYGVHPSMARFAAESYGIQVIETIVARKMVRSRSKFLRAAAYMAIGGSVVDRSRDVTGNLLHHMTPAGCAPR